MMDDGDLMEVNLTDLDLNQDPVDSLLRVERVGSLLNELETAHDRIEERIRQLEAVTARARHGQRWRQPRNSVDTTSSVHDEIMVDIGQRRAPDENGRMSIVERGFEGGKGCKRDSSHLVAKALEMDSEVKKPEKEDGSFYDCNICLDVAREPVLTGCGHLFCWPCFYQVSKVDSTAKECPVCKGEVSDSTVIPIYGNGGTECVTETELGLKIPPRPKTPRVESHRQQRVTQGLSHVPVTEALRRIRISIGAIGNQTQVQEGGDVVLNSRVEFQAGQNSESATGPRVRIHQVSRVLSESAASLSSLSSALSNAERLVENLETVINNRLLQNRARAMILNATSSLNRSSVLTQSHNQTPNPTADMNGALPISSTASQSTDVSGSIPQVVNLRNINDGTLPVPHDPYYISRFRGINFSRTSDRDNQDTRESRRRRLN